MFFMTLPLVPISGTCNYIFLVNSSKLLCSITRIWHIGFRGVLQSVQHDTVRPFTLLFILDNYVIKNVESTV